MERRRRKSSSWTRPRTTNCTQLTCGAWTTSNRNSNGTLRSSRKGGTPFQTRAYVCRWFHVQAKHQGEVKGGPPPGRPDIKKLWTEISKRPEFIWQENKEGKQEQVFLWTEAERDRAVRLQEVVDLLCSYPSKSRDAHIQFVLDTREKGPITQLMTTVPQVAIGTCSNGDAQVLINKHVHYICERKAYSDASQHIGTSVQEQHLRLLKCGLPRQQIEWIFEHEPLANEEARSRWKPQSHLDAWGASAKQRDGVKFEWRADMLDTAYHWMRSIEAYLKHGHMFVIPGNSEQLMPLGDPESGALLIKSHAQYLKGGLSKAKIKTPDQQWEAQLSVPVGAGVAAAIAKVKGGCACSPWFEKVPL